MSWFNVNAISLNWAGVYRIVESDDHQIWFSASEYADTDVWKFDPSSGLYTSAQFDLVDQKTAYYPFDSLSDIATDGAGTQYSTWVSGGEGPESYQPYDDAGTHGSPIGTPSGYFPYNGVGYQIMWTASGLVVAGGSYGSVYACALVDFGTDTFTWINNPSNLNRLDCVGPDGHVWGVDSTSQILSKIDPATGTETTIATLTGSASWGVVATDGTNMWVYDQTYLKVFSTGGTLLHSYTIPLITGWGVPVYRPHDGLMYFAGLDSSGKDIPLYSVDPSTGTIVQQSPSIWTQSAAIGGLNRGFCYSDGKTLYFGLSYSTAGGQLLQLAEPKTLIVGIF